MPNRIQKLNFSPPSSPHSPALPEATLATPRPPRPREGQPGPSPSSGAGQLAPSTHSLSHTLVRDWQRSRTFSSPDNPEGPQNTSQGQPHPKRGISLDQQQFFTWNHNDFVPAARPGNKGLSDPEDVEFVAQNSQKDGETKQQYAIRLAETGRFGPKGAYDLERLCNLLRYNKMWVYSIPELKPTFMYPYSYTHVHPPTAKDVSIRNQFPPLPEHKNRIKYLDYLVSNGQYIEDGVYDLNGLSRAAGVKLNNLNRIRPELKQGAKRKLDSISGSEAGGPSGLPPIKTEEASTPVTSSAPPEVWELVYDDMAVARFKRAMPSIDLTGDAAVQSVYHDPANSVVVREDGMVPDPAMDDVFALRDPYRPRQVHPLYADPADPTRTHPDVRIEKPVIGRGFITYLNDLAAHERGKPPGNRRLDMTGSQVRAAIDQVERAVQAEVERTMVGNPHNAPVCETRLLTKDDVMSHEEKLVGQYGLFVRPGTKPEDMPTLGNGRIVGLFAGALLRWQDELDQQQETYGETALNRYALDTESARGMATAMLSPIGGANSGAFANTALNPGADKPEYDQDRINAILVNFNVKLNDKDGQPRKEVVVAIVALDNLKSGEQVFLNYGEKYLPQFRPAPASPVDSRAEGVEIKMEE